MNTLWDSRFYFVAKCKFKKKGNKKKEMVHNMNIAFINLHNL